MAYVLNFLYAHIINFNKTFRFGKSFQYFVPERAKCDIAECMLKTCVVIFPM